jgi:hypothetical protein
MELRKYWAEVREIEGGLPEFVWLTSSGVVVEVGRAAAARLLWGGSHRVATEEEVAEFKAGEERGKKSAAEERLWRRGVAVVEVGS